MMVQYGETVKITTRPKTFTYEKCLKILQDNCNDGVTIKSLFEWPAKTTHRSKLHWNKSINGT